MDEPEEVLVPIEEALAGMQIVDLPAGYSWVGALLLVKLGGEAGFGWSVRRTEGLSDEELLGQAVVLVEMLRDKIRFRE
jgi:hypothetical protein